MTQSTPINPQTNTYFRNDYFDGLAELAKLTTLQQLTIGECKNITADGITKFRQQRPDVTLMIDGKEYPAK